MTSGDTGLNPSRKSFTLVPSKGKKPSRKSLTMTSFLAACSRNIAALVRASCSRSLVELKTTQTTSMLRFCESNRRIVPPQPISMSSECEPKHKILRGAEGEGNAKASMPLRSQVRRLRVALYSRWFSIIPKGRLQQKVLQVVAYL